MGGRGDGEHGEGGKRQVDRGGVTNGDKSGGGGVDGEEGERGGSAWRRRR